MPLNPKLVLKGGKEKHIRHGHPWIFASAIERVEDSPQPGWTADVVTYDGRWVAKVGYSPKSQLRARVWTLNEGEEVDAAFFERRIRSAIGVREKIGRMDPQGACRVINAEGDRLPGLVVDRFADVLVVQINSSPMEYWRETILNALEAALSPRGIYERSDSDNRGKEGLDKRVGWVRGEAVDADIEITEFGAVFGVDVVQGHKTGFYLDQAENRALVREWSSDARVLNCFSYTGGFSVQAALGGAREVVSVDSSQPALDLSAANFARNGLGEDERFTHWCSDVFKALDSLRDEGRVFDLVILDPPKFASAGAHVERALHAYRKLARAGIPLVAPGGVMLTFSCSGAVTPEAFQKSVRLALSDNHRRGRILKRLAAATDHVTDFGFGEGAYLKGLAIEIE